MVRLSLNFANNKLFFIATVIQKIRELFNISATAAECRLWMNDKVLNEFHKSLLDEEITDGEVQCIDNNAT